MKGTLKHTSSKSDLIGNHPKSYNEVIEFLDAHWNVPIDESHRIRLKKLDQALGNPSKSLKTIWVAGTNGKSLTINFASQLLKAEGLSVGAFYSPHILTYNERIACNNETIANKAFADVANEVIQAAETLQIIPHSFEVLSLMAMLYFKEQKVDVALFEVENSVYQTAELFTPSIVAITRIVVENKEEAEEEIKRALSIVHAGTHVVSADQSKLQLHAMHALAEQRGGLWAMPTRKLVDFSYTYRPMGRCGALAERIAYTFINTICSRDSIVVTGSLLTKQETRRGRPSHDAKRKLLLEPKPKIENFWKETSPTIAGRFQLLERDKPSVLLDNADNLDAFENLLLGIRLIHYRRPLKGLLTLIIGCDNPSLNTAKLAPLLRYFFKKTTSGQVILCPVTPTVGKNERASWNVEQAFNDLNSFKIKNIRTAKSFAEAFELARKTVQDERHGLLVITGSSAIVSEYWKYKGIKKL